MNIILCYKDELDEKQLTEYVRFLYFELFCSILARTYHKSYDSISVSFKSPLIFKIREICMSLNPANYFDFKTFCINSMKNSELKKLLIDSWYSTDIIFSHNCRYFEKGYYNSHTLCNFKNYLLGAFK